MMRFYTPQSGEILIDHKPITDYNLSSLRSNINLVSQRVLLFKGTIRENLQISKPNATDEELWEALDSVQAREFIELLPGQLSTMIQENGRNLSVGQKQMISFARAILSNPSACKHLTLLFPIDPSPTAKNLISTSSIRYTLSIWLIQTQVMFSSFV